MNQSCKSVEQVLKLMYQNNLMLAYPNLTIVYRLCLTLSVTILQQPRTRSKHYGDRTFSSAAPRPWNALPNQIRNSNSVEIFKVRIKTHLFKIYFE